MILQIFSPYTIVIIGYDIDHKQVPYWLIRNSWGTDWGESGYAKIIRNQDMCGIAENAYYIVLE